MMVLSVLCNLLLVLLALENLPSLVRSNLHDELETTVPGPAGVFKELAVEEELHHVGSRSHQGQQLQQESLLVPSE